MNYRETEEAVGWLVILFGLAVFGSWIVNVVKFLGMLGGEVNALFIARIVGIPVVPLGAILGWF